MELNEFGEIVKNEWLKTESIRPNVKMDKFVVMPNHFHGIVIIKSVQKPNVGATGRVAHNHVDVSTPCRGVLQYALTETPLQSPSQTLGAIMRGFKSSVTKKINRYRGMPGYPVWHRNYYERIIRNKNELNGIREYITTNPPNWHEDEYFACGY